jgi:hypothetical protein
MDRIKPDFAPTSSPSASQAPSAPTVRGSTVSGRSPKDHKTRKKDFGLICNRAPPSSLQNYVLALLIGLPVSVAGLQTTNPPAITGVWESERCDVQERNGTRTSSKSVFVFLESECGESVSIVLLPRASFCRTVAIACVG